MRAHIAILSAHGAVSDPGPATVLNRGTLTLTNLQAIFSLLRDAPGFYNVTSYLVCGVMMVVAIVVMVRRQPGENARWLGMAFAAALTLLPVYHRQYDAKLLILTIPACAVLWSQRTRLSIAALIVTVLGLSVTADLPWAFYLAFTSRMQLSGVAARLYFLSLAATVPLTVALVALFYLGTFAKVVRESESIQVIEEPQHVVQGS
jgi:hypothetical protein